MSTNGTSNNQSKELRAVEAQSRDVGRGIARLDPIDIEKLGAVTGDILEITGKRRTVAKVMPAFKEFRGQQLLQIDGIIRDNAGVGINEKVVVQVAQPQLATMLQLTPVTQVSRRPGYHTYIGKLIDGLPVVTGDRIRATLFGSRFQEFKVQKTEPEGVVIIHPTTVFTISDPKFQAAGAGERQAKIAYEDIGGLKREVERVREMIELPLKHPMIFERLGIEPPRGLLLVGPPGVGKTLIARVIAQETNAHFVSMSGPEILHKFYGESEARLRQIFEDAARNQPAIIFIDEIDAIAPRRGSVPGEVEKRLLGQLLTLIDGLRDRGQLVVIGATNAPGALDPALRRSGRFDREVRLGIPSIHGRKEILEIHSRGMPLAEDVNLDALAALTHGFVGADLHSLCREAALAALRRVMFTDPDLNLNLVEEKLQQIQVAMEDFHQALKLIEPSALRGITVETPESGWHRVGGLAKIREALNRSVLLPLKYPEVYTKLGVQIASGVLLYGPPGSGKTLLVRALAGEGKIHFISVRGPELLSKYINESDRVLHDIFRQAKQSAPCIIFFDEVDALMPSFQDGLTVGASVSDRIFGQLLAELDGVGELKGVMVLAATNKLERIDSALQRAGRFDICLEVPMPEVPDLKEIFSIHLNGRQLTEGISLDALAAKAKGLNGADVEAACRIAIGHAVEVWIHHRTTHHKGKEKHMSEPHLTQTALVEAIELVRQMRRV
ncbi:MAG: AAA family ATPase [Blastocatellia bacterium]|nr:AAA family ATPase [Blastocatellia bacterium]